MSDPTLPSATAATRSLLIADADMAALLPGLTAEGTPRVNVFCQAMPEDMASAKAQAAIVVRNSPGTQPMGGYSELVEPSYDIYCTGETHEQAWAVHQRMQHTLRQARRQVFDQCLLHSYDQISAPRSGNDPQTQWPYVMTTWKSLASSAQAV